MRNLLLPTDISGIELCDRVRRDFPSFCTYIIILTAMTDIDKIVKRLGCWSRRLLDQALSC